MRTVAEIYEEYRIPPWLQLHQLRVAAVGKMTSESILGADTHLVTLACLFHDMGAIVKFDFRYQPPGFESFYDEHGVEYWISVQQEFRARYGEKEHDATDAILAELDLPDAVQNIVSNMGLAHAAAILESDSLELQIAEYADQRVGPLGVLSLVERLADMKKRYSRRWEKDSYAEKDAQFETSAKKILELGDVLQMRASKPLDEIANDAVAPLVAELKKYAIS